MLRAFRATAPAELQALLRDEGVVATDDPVMQELAPLVAAVHTMPKFTFSSFILGSVKGPRPGAPSVPHETAQDMELRSKVKIVGIPGPNK